MPDERENRGAAAVSSSAATFGAVRTEHPDSLPPGTVLQDRYEIVGLLGHGGMGAVYKALDRAIDRPVALKVIRPELAQSAEAIERFKQELIHARKVSHRNVVRIHDLGESNGVRFITMDYVEGLDLGTVLESRGKLPLQEAVAVMRQVFLGLDAAHNEGIVHRDLKPQNIMIGEAGKVFLMDFGLARSTEFGGMTQTGAMVGTMRYMSPEQANGQPADHRSDLYAAGLIFYEVLAGVRPYEADSELASLIRRSQERVIAPMQLDKGLPKHVSDIICRCLERDPQDRFQTAAEVLVCLDGQQSIPIVRRATGRGAQRLLQRAIAGTSLLLIASASAYYMSHNVKARQVGTQEPAQPVVAVAILPLRNASGDPKLDWLSTGLPEMLNTDVGRSATLHTISSSRIHELFQDLRLAPNSEMDTATLRRVADFTSARDVVSGQFVKVGEQIRIDLSIYDLQADRSVPVKFEANSDKALLADLDKLASKIREQLAIPPAERRELQAQSFRPSSVSVDALAAYVRGMELQRQSKNLKALPSFEAATQADPNFALAFSALGQSYSALGRSDEAVRASRHAVELAENLDGPEKLRIGAAHALISRDTDRAIQAYEKLAKITPDDPDVMLVLGNLYQKTGGYDKARAQYRGVLKQDPKSLLALLNLGRTEILGDQPQVGIELLNRALSLSIELNNDEQRAAVFHALGAAYRALDKPAEALLYKQDALRLRQQLGDKHGMADTLHGIAQLQADLGHSQAAEKGYREALALMRAVGDDKAAGDILIDFGTLDNARGHYDDALESFKQALQVERSVGDRNYEALCLNNIGASYFFKGQYEDARTYYEQSLALREKLGVPGDTADTLHNVGETLAYMGDFDQSLRYYIRALDLRRSSGDKRGAAIDAYSMSTLFEYQGRYGAAISSIESALGTFREIGEKGYWMAEALAGYGEALALAGRAQQAAQPLAEALQMAKVSKSDAVLAEALNAEGDLKFFTGQVEDASRYYASALPVAQRTKDMHLILITRFNVAKTEVKRGNTRAAVPTLRSISRQAHNMGLEHLSVETALYMAEALQGTRQSAAAETVLLQAISRSERSGMQLLLAEAHRQMADSNPNAQGAEQHATTARRILTSLRNESGAELLPTRSDLALIASSPVGDH